MTSWASCSSWEPPRRPDSRRKPAPPNRPGLPDTFCTARPYRKWAGLLVQNRYFWFKMDFWCKATPGIKMGDDISTPENVSPLGPHVKVTPGGGLPDCSCFIHHIAPDGIIFTP